MKVLVFVDCEQGVCKRLRDTADTLSRRIGFEVEYFTAEENKEEFKYWGVCGVPWVVVVDDLGKKIGWFTGAQTLTSFERNLVRCGASP